VWGEALSDCIDKQIIITASKITTTKSMNKLKDLLEYHKKRYPLSTRLLLLESFISSNNDFEFIKEVINTTIAIIPMLFVGPDKTDK